MFSSPFLASLFLASVAAFVATLGLIAVAIRSDWSKRNAGLFAIAASGLLLTMTITHVAPDALRGHRYAPFVMLGGFFLGLIVHDVLRLTLTGEGASRLAAGITPLVAIAIHSLLDGVVYTVTFQIRFETGLFATLGLILHEFPEGIIAFALIRGTGLSNRLSFIFAFIAAALTTPLGALIASAFVNDMSSQTLALLFALSAGLILFVSTGPLMAHMQTEKPARSLAALSIGVIVALAIAALSPGHSHGHHHENHMHDHTVPPKRFK